MRQYKWQVFCKARKEEAQLVSNGTGPRSCILLTRSYEAFDAKLAQKPGSSVFIDIPLSRNTKLIIVPISGMVTCKSKEKNNSSLTIGWFINSWRTLGCFSFLGSQRPVKCQIASPSGHSSYFSRMCIVGYVNWEFIVYLSLTYCVVELRFEPRTIRSHHIGYCWSTSLTPVSI